MRTTIYALAFLGIMVGTGLTTIGPALLALPATMLVGFAFGGLGSALATLVRTWQDFDYITLVCLRCSFSPVPSPRSTSTRLGVRLVVEALPLHHAVELVRGITTGRPGCSA